MLAVNVYGPKRLITILYGDYLASSMSIRAM